MDVLKQTPLFPVYQEYGGKTIDFGGWALPVQYKGILDEHAAVRTQAGLFDVSHMGEIVLSGPDAFASIQRLITNDISRLEINQAMYSPMCYEHGGCVDDLLVYRLAGHEYLLVVNAANIEKDFEWISAHVQGDVHVENKSGEIAQLALQGPKSEQILRKLTAFDLSQIRYYWFAQNVEVAGIQALISRTGYTGEDGFELYVQADQAVQLWNRLLAAGKEDGLVPIGLGARDTLRFEARLPLYGQEISADISPLEAGLGMFVKLDKGEFIGRAALQEQKTNGVKRKLVGFEMVERGIPRSHYEVQVNGQTIGQVTTGTFAPTLKKNLGLALVDVAYASMGQEFDVIIRNKPVRAVVMKTPFYKRAK
ncbi:glycine cleavage system aminomethyltransferase GcvT [Fodinisporobacter ferrooxydans]|uniref:Aminomethyltransferase n=1 Tax=Fodinisporobacter ferrooxydans TaxID=2901836 RepID=A0ABY4CHY7_9BACL|nr:glycine cleavage system aminomethyltransferase GcvT [Alicyclobacillaceae bacterium MYW30-H2]